MVPAPKSMRRDAERRFIGRQSELDALHAALERAVAGQPCIVLLAGEPGIGKTRTAQEIVDHAGQSNVLALWGRCPEEPGAPPYWPWLQLIRRYVALHDEPVLRQTMGSAAARIAALDPELARGMTDGPAPPAETDAAASRFRGGWISATRAQGSRGSTSRRQLPLRPLQRAARASSPTSRLPATSNCESAPMSK